MSTPLVSIILPTYNRINFLKRSIKSVFVQSFKDWELIIIYNNSVDGTEEYLNDLSISDKRIKIMKVEKSKIHGISEYLNIGISVSRGKYIARLDDDDEWCQEDKLKLQVDFFNKNPSYVLTGGGEIMRDSKNNILYKVLKNEKDYSIRKRALVSCPFEHPTVMFRRDVCLKVGNYKPLKLSEDWEFFLNLGREGKIYNFPEYFVYYTQWKGNQSMSESIQSEIALTAIRIIKMYKNDYPNYQIGIGLHFIQYIYSFFPEFIRDRQKYFLRRIKRSI